MKLNYVHRLSRLFALVLTVLLTVAAAGCNRGIKPVQLPDPGIPGFTFPTPQDEIIQWTQDNNQTAINQHAWGIWTALTQETKQTFEGQKLRVFETWQTPDQVIAGETTIVEPRPLGKLRQLEHASSNPSNAAEAATPEPKDTAEASAIPDEENTTSPENTSPTAIETATPAADIPVAAEDAPIEQENTIATAEDSSPTAAAEPATAIEDKIVAARDTIKEEKGTITGFVKYDPTAAKHITQNNLFSKAKLDELLQSGAKKIPDFPDTAIALKPVFQTISQDALVDGRYYKIAAWPEPPVNAQAPVPAKGSIPFPSSSWNQCVWIDLENEGQGDGSVDTTCSNDASSRTATNTYDVSSWINFRFSAAQAQLLNARLQKLKAEADSQSRFSLPTAVAEGDYAVLKGMHVTSREIPRWTWQTFWWTPNPDSPHFPSSAAIAKERPEQLQGAPRHYAHASAYSMVNPPQPDTGGKNEGDSIYAYNPWLEAGFSSFALPASKPKGTNDVGIQTNCMSCHLQANYPEPKFPPGFNPPNPFYTGDRYISLDDPEFNGKLQVDFLWSIADKAK